MKRESNNPVYAAILARVSTRNQEDNSSLDDQIDRCREYCIQHGYTATAERREIMSGSFVLARSVFNELLEMAADGGISVIVVDIPDRLGRGDVIANLESHGEVEQCADRICPTRS